MKNFYCFQLHKKAPLDDIWQQLEQFGVEIAYSSEEEDGNWIYGYLEVGRALPQLKAIVDIQKTELPAIDWEAQWETHGLNFYEGCIHVDLETKEHEPLTLCLKPGPGFGDLSHPTTRLVLQMMKQTVQQGPFIDIGCGSGILTVAAAAMGAPVAYGIDIDPEALRHASENAQINQMEKQCRFSLPNAFQPPIEGAVVIAMNMILSEQKQAWTSLPSLHGLPGIILTSGIREEERNLYLKQASEWKWKLVEEAQEGGWLAFQFMSTL